MQFVVWYRNPSPYSHAFVNSYLVTLHNLKTNSVVGKPVQLAAYNPCYDIEFDPVLFGQKVRHCLLRARLPPWLGLPVRALVWGVY